MSHDVQCNYEDEVRAREMAAERQIRDAEEAGGERMVVCESCGGDGSFDRVVGHDPSGPVWSDEFCPTCQGAGEYAVETEPVTLDDISN